MGPPLVGLVAPLIAPGLISQPPAVHDRCMLGLRTSLKWRNMRMGY